MNKVESVNDFPDDLTCEGITLDGVNERLIINHKEISVDLKWNFANEKYDIIEPIVNVMLLLGKN